MADNMILDYPDELLRLSLSFLGVGHFAFIALVCSRFKIAYLANDSDEMITTAESVTSSISRAEKYFEDAGTDYEQLRFFWCNVARYGRVDVMEWAHQQGYSRVWSEQFHGRIVGYQVCMKAAECGQLATLQWLRQNGCSWDIETSSVAAKGGHLSVLQWARANGCEWDSQTCSSAALGGHLSVLQWVRENECPWNEMTCSNAAGGGHIPILQWARENGCAWDSYTCYRAAEGGHLSVLQRATENGCLWDIQIYDAATSCGNPDVLNYVRHHWSTQEEDSEPFYYNKIK